MIFWNFLEGSIFLNSESGWQFDIKALLEMAPFMGLG